MSKFTLHSDFPVRGVRLARTGSSDAVREYSEDMLGKIVDQETRKNRQAWEADLEQERQAAYGKGFEAGVAQTEQRYLKEFGKSFQVLRRLPAEPAPPSSARSVRTFSRRARREKVSGAAAAIAANRFPATSRNRLPGG